MALKAVSSGEKISNVESWRVAVAVPVHSKKDYVFAGYATRIPFARFWWNEPAAVLIGRLAVVVALSVIVCYGLSVYITSPILGLQSATRRFAKGELSARAGAAVTRRKDEMGALANSFDNMAERIGSLLNLQRQLVGDISHELRSPLARLTLSIEMTKTMSGPEAEQLLARMEREVGILNGMIGQLLNLSELESGIMSLSPVQINLKEMVEIIAGDADFEAQSAGKKVRLGDTAGCWIFGNNSLLHSAVENVVRNAVRYTKPGTEVALSIVSVARDGGRYAELTVTDQGGGVPEADLENIFRPFYRVSTSRDRKSGGTGLGLHITERAVRIHNGQVRAENVEGGLRVTITLPLNGVVAGLPKEQSL
jgi:two-component system sensor histidine kinase CpxA